MRDTLMISDSTAPCDEDCLQVGTENYKVRATAQGLRFIALIRATLGKEPEGAELFIKWNPHDFGYYPTIECRFDTDNEAAREYAFKCEGNLPTQWGPLTDEEARAEVAALVQDPIRRMCLVPHPGGWPDKPDTSLWCTRPGEHTGEHIACEMMTGNWHLVTRWQREAV